ncbi:MAG: DNA-processing protein DprA [Eggerthellaceae bacterium]|nr:DNA-processing protein DprA [Eggerthellaceae bacterium]
MSPHAALSGERTVLKNGDAGYPAALASIARPPKELFVVGNPAALAEGLAVVGARRATPYGRSCARRFARLAASQGVCIISGGARGCDSEAHRAALTEGAPTVAFLGGGCDEIYPAENRGLFQKMIDDGGAVVSEHAWGFKPLPYTFRERNRLIAGLAKAVLIVEASLPSGTFSTADEALEAGKEVLVVPGAITSDSSRGTNRLLYQGATPVVDDESFEYAVSRIFGVLRHEQISSGAKKERKADAVMDALKAQPMSLDELYEIARDVYGENARSTLMKQLARAEAEHEVKRHHDGRYYPMA